MEAVYQKTNTQLESWVFKVGVTPTILELEKFSLR